MGKSENTTIVVIMRSGADLIATKKSKFNLNWFKTETDLRYFHETTRIFSLSETYSRKSKASFHTATRTDVIIFSSLAAVS